MSLNKNAKASVSESIGSNLDFYTIRSTVNFAAVTTAPETVLDTVIRTISLRSQPVIMNLEPSEVAAAGDADGFTVGATVYTLKFALEHARAWEALGSTALKDALVASGAFTAPQVGVHYFAGI